MSLAIGLLSAAPVMPSPAWAGHLLIPNPGSPQSDVCHCDLTADGRLDAADVLVASRLASGEVVLPPDELAALEARADLAPLGTGGDGEVNPADVGVMARVVEGDFGGGCP